MRMIFGAIGGIKIGRGTRSTRRKPTPAPLFAPQNPTWQTRSRLLCISLWLNIVVTDQWKNGLCLPSNRDDLGLAKVVVNYDVAEVPRQLASSQLSLGTRWDDVILRCGFSLFCLLRLVDTHSGVRCSRVWKCWRLPPKILLKLNKITSGQQPNCWYTASIVLESRSV
jgi:hypothetical protein